MFVPFYTNQNHKVNFIFLVFFCSLRNMENVFGSSGQSSKLVREYLMDGWGERNRDVPWTLSAVRGQG